MTMSLAELKGLMAETAKEAARAALKEDQEKLASQSQAASEQTLGALSAASAIHGVSLMQPSTVPSLGPSLSTSVSVEAVAPTVTALSSSAEACIVGEGTTPIPTRLVRLIQAQEYVDFAELFPDTLELLRRIQATAEPANRRRLRQITTLPTWVQCFATYAGILLRKHPARAQEVMAYLRLVAHKAQRHSGTGWLLYDARFRQLAASNRSLS